MIRMHKSTRSLWSLLTAVVVLAGAFGANSAAATSGTRQSPVCFTTLSGDTLRISGEGVQAASFAVDGDSFDLTFYCYEPTGQLCIRFTDKNGDDRKIALGTDLQLAVSGAFDTLTLNPSLGGARFYLKSDASANDFNVNFTGTAFVYGGVGNLSVNGTAAVSLQPNADVDKVSLNKRGASLSAASGSSAARVTRVSGASVTRGGGKIGRVDGPSSSSRDDDDDWRYDGWRYDDWRYDSNRIVDVTIRGLAVVGETVDARVSYRYDRPYGSADYQWYVRTPGGRVSALYGETDSALYIDGIDVAAGDAIQVRVEGWGDTRGSASSGWRTIGASGNP